MIIEIKSKIDQSVLFSLETGSIKMALEIAAKQGVDLSNADLEGADLRGAILEDAKLAVANMRFCDLSGADLARAVLKNADLEGTCLVNTGFVKSDLRGAKYDTADGRGATTGGAQVDPGKEVNK